WERGLQLDGASGLLYRVFELEQGPACDLVLEGVVIDVDRQSGVAFHRVLDLGQVILRYAKVHRDRLELSYHHQCLRIGWMNGVSRIDHLRFNPPVNGGSDTTIGKAESGTIEYRLVILDRRHQLPGDRPLIVEFLPGDDVLLEEFPVSGKLR